MANELDSNSMDLPPLIEGDVYLTVSGAQTGAIFQYKFGHRRQFPTLEDFAPYKRRGELRRIQITDAARIPVGPAMPRSHAMTTKRALSASDNIDQIREAFCREFHGHGYEIGAGERPTIVPEQCHVTYADRFTFEEARDGSFRNKTADNFVKVSIYEPMERLASIRDESSDFFIACHVLEHCIDVIGCLREVHQKLRKGGRMFFVLPDKRYMFDSGRPVTHSSTSSATRYMARTLAPWTTTSSIVDGARKDPIGMTPQFRSGAISRTIIITSSLRSLPASCWASSLATFGWRAGASTTQST
jgi:methyltransferase family protein